MLIGVDLDDVLADFIPALIEFHNNNYGSSLSRDQFKSYKFWETWGGTREEAIEKVYEFHETSYFKDMNPFPDSQLGINELNQDNQLVIITSRQDDVAKMSKEWLNEHFSNIFSAVYFTNHYSQNGSSSRTKLEICDELGVHLLIEDSLDYSLECVTPNRDVLLINSPWNQSSELPKGIYRVGSWKEIVEISKTTN